MNLETQIFSFAQRQDELQTKISKALEAGDQELVSSLETKWAHRYGLDTLKKLQISFQHGVEKMNIESRTNISEIIGNIESAINKEEMESINNIESAINKEEMELIGNTKPFLKNELDRFQSSTENEYKLDHLLINRKKNLDNSSENQSSDQIIESKQLEPLSIPRPPRPKLKRLRRWIPDITEENLPEAS